MPRRDGPGRVAVLQLERRTERIDDVRPPEQVDPEFLHLLALAPAIAEHAESDVDPTVGERERPRVTREQIRFEPHVQLLARRAGDVAAVLTEAVPLAEVAGFVDSERLADGAPHAVSGDDVPRVDLETLGEHRHPVGVLDETFESVAVANVGATLPGESYQGVIELETWCDGGVLPGRRQCDDDPASTR